MIVSREEYLAMIIERDGNLYAPSHDLIVEEDGTLKYDIIKTAEEIYEDTLLPPEEDHPGTEERLHILRDWFRTLDGKVDTIYEGKELIANAITEKGVPSSGTDTFATLANNISMISGEGGGAGKPLRLIADASVSCGSTAIISRDLDGVSLQLSEVYITFHQALSGYTTSVGINNSIKSFNASNANGDDLVHFLCLPDLDRLENNKKMTRIMATQSKFEISTTMRTASCETLLTEDKGANPGGIFKISIVGGPSGKYGTCSYKIWGRDL